VHKGISNLVAYSNPANEHIKVNHASAKNILQDSDLKLLPWFKQPVMETQNKAWS
jgi:hypothetical protein